MAKLSLVAAAQQHSMVITHTFNAPRELVFKLMTDPKPSPSGGGRPASA